ncbi:MAG: hypothetical protein QIT35_gp81 [Methanophagales virus PBV299]|uniref:Uncharacterized protein n=1 Tax=Methanophagales virus PBV299 TaxID=2987730 RepID=A0ABY6GLP2_9CAUD|nr:MAG: hypothetical protein QIT35_gp81 [Methanophagales virus PBV299]UYL64877.1 MAG: hypothetical protein OFDIEDLO_00081 [Methanophagales virus PBV299]
MESCKKRIGEAYKETIKDIRRVWRAYKEQSDEEIYDYGLCFDFVKEDNEEPYFRWQLAWGGPAEEFRFYVGPDFEVYKIEFWFMDWFDGAKITLRGRDYELLAEIWDVFFRDVAEYEFRERGGEY